MKTTLQSLLALSAVAVLATSAHAQITGFNVNFDADATTYTENFVRFGDSAVGETGLNWGASGGTNGGGGLVVSEASARNIFYRPSPASDATSTFNIAGLGATNTFSSSLDFRWADTSSTALTVITAGFTPENASQTALTSDGALAGSIIRNNSSTVTLRMRNNNGTVANTFDFAQSTFTAGNWYRLSYDITKDAVENQFSYTVSLYSIGADGTSTATLFNDGTKNITITGSVSNSLVYADTEAYWGYDIRDTLFSGVPTNKGITHVDNFVVSGAAIPEPSSFALLAGGLTLLVCAGKRRRATRAAD